MRGRKTFLDFAEELSKESGMSIKDSRIVMRHFINVLMKNIFDNEIVFRGFGKFSIKRCKSKATLNNVFTDHYYKLSFIPSEFMRDKVKKKARELSLKE